MNIQYLRYFIEVSKIKSMSGASEALHISQQGLSKAMKSLEASLGVRLLSRSSKGITLTREGQAVLRRAKRIAAECDGLEREVAELRADTAVLEGAGMNVVSSLIGIVSVIDELRGKGHLSGLVLRQAETEEALLDARDPDWLILVDLPWRSRPLASLGGYEVVSVLESKMGLLVADGLLPGASASVSPKLASTLPLGLADPITMRSMNEDIFAGCPLRDVRLRTTNENELVGGVARGRFAAVIPVCFWDKLARTSPDAGRFSFAELECDVGFTLAFVRDKRVPMRPEQRRFAETFARAFAAGCQ